MLLKATALWLLAVLLPFSKCHPWFGYLNRTDPTVPVIYKMFEPVWDESKNNELSEPLYVKRCDHLSHCFSIFTLTFFFSSNGNPNATAFTLYATWNIDGDSRQCDYTEDRFDASDVIPELSQIFGPYCEKLTAACTPENTCWYLSFFFSFSFFPPFFFFLFSFLFFFSSFLLFFFLLSSLF